MAGYNYPRWDARTLGLSTRVRGWSHVPSTTVQWELYCQFHARERFSLTGLPVKIVTAAIEPPDKGNDVLQESVSSDNEFS